MQVYSIIYYNVILYVYAYIILYRSCIMSHTNNQFIYTKRHSLQTSQEICLYITPRKLLNTLGILGTLGNKVLRT